MKNFKKISIKNIKGIGSEAIFNFDFPPNKPCVLVAPNGFGKSSIACAFDSLNANRVDLNKGNYHCGDEDLNPQLQITIGSKIYTADENRNEISKTFDCHVISNPLVPKATKGRVGKLSTVSASMEIKPVELVATIPGKENFIYSWQEQRERFGQNGKILNNIRELIDDVNFMCQFQEKTNFADFRKALTYKKPLKLIIAGINKQTGNTTLIKSWVKENMVKEMRKIASLNSLADLVNTAKGYPEVDNFFAAIQLVECTFSDNFSKALKFNEYKKKKQSFDDMLIKTNSTRFNISTQEKRQGKGSSRKKLIVGFPKADEMSNGERDILSFVAQMLKTKSKSNQKDCILVIDEIFDYLDDANIVAFQYYITQLIENFKAQERHLYPLLLTHLDPNHFKHFCFNKHKMRIYYLAQNPNKIRSTFLRLVQYRESESIKEKADKHFFHYHPDEIKLGAEFVELSLKKEWGNSLNFYEIIYKEVREKYLLSDASDYDPVAILLALRVKIEERAYFELRDESHKAGFLKTPRTLQKLEFCEERGISIPEINYLLSLIYNANLHLSNETDDVITPLVSKLENKTIKKMISEIFRQGD